MKTKTSIIVIVAFTIFSACNDTKNVEKENKEKTLKEKALYVINQDSIILVYRHDSRNPILLETPVQLERLKEYAIPSTVILENQKHKGIQRYIDGEVNNTYE